VAGFPVLTDNHVRQPIVEALLRLEWKVVRSVDAAGWAFRMVFWKHKHHERMSDGDIVRALEELARKPNAFAYPIEYIKPKR
jgi:hypothetical protein